MLKITKILLLTLLISTASAFVQKKAKVLIIGDSISIGYTPFVQGNLENIAEVVHNPGNGKHTGNGLIHVEEWLGDTDWDVVQFNWGLWDLCYRNPTSTVQGNRDKVNGDITYSIEEYASNLDALVKKIKTKTDAKLIFVTTTYVPENEAGRFPEDPIRYNEVAKKVMKENNVMINDIYQSSISIHHEYGKGNDDVHYTPSGYEKLGKEIADFLKREIGEY
ncbi:SGNH/GDSL hydrolase family protein [Echinicola strongylocentroti]|uniref:SGNH/GDSL hydrolase family protein n=1 Tax=Echinicola strongylocentroti TaxID=1795355 RepID=A0A2Z4IPI8_9BACT|nr:SGNH/GDSL hydrolase family protein [Echinicola strongylocentroti]AWW32714.1 SGNH/GDSL hydrolase family protein [Echinicola strongylocentroti]